MSIKSRIYHEKLLSYRCSVFCIAFQPSNKKKMHAKKFVSVNIQFKYGFQTR